MFWIDATILIATPPSIPAPLPFSLSLPSPHSVAFRQRHQVVVHLGVGQHGERAPVDPGAHDAHLDLARFQVLPQHGRQGTDGGADGSVGGEGGRVGLEEGGKGGVRLVCACPLPPPFSPTQPNQPRTFNFFSR